MKIIIVLCAIAAVLTAFRWTAAQEEAERRMYDYDGK